jgi:hypothetical protein
MATMSPDLLNARLSTDEVLGTDRPHHDLYTFECPGCGRLETRTSCCGHPCRLRGFVGRGQGRAPDEGQACLGISPGRLHCRGGAVVVAAHDAGRIRKNQCKELGI